MISYALNLRDGWKDSLSVWSIHYHKLFQTNTSLKTQFTQEVLVRWWGTLGRYNGENHGQTRGLPSTSKAPSGSRGKALWVMTLTCADIWMNAIIHDIYELPKYPSSNLNDKNMNLTSELDPGVIHVRGRDISYVTPWQHQTLWSSDNRWYSLRLFEFNLNSRLESHGHSVDSVDIRCLAI